MTSIKGAIVSTVYINPRYIFVKVPGSGNMGSKLRVQRSEVILKANRRISNIEPQNFEGWIRFAQSVLIKNDSMPSFGIRHSTFDILRFCCSRLNI